MMKSQTRNSEIERIYKNELALSLGCWIFTSPFSEWTEKLFTADVTCENGIVTRDTFFRFVVNGDGYEAGHQARGTELCCFSFPEEMMPSTEMAEFDMLTFLTGEVINGILLTLPEYMDLPPDIAYQIRDQVHAFNFQCGDGIFHGWSTSNELWKNEIYPRLTILLNKATAIH